MRTLNDNLDIIATLSDEPNDLDGLSASELKAKFDQAGNTIKNYINNTLIPDIATQIEEEVSNLVVESGNLPTGGSTGQALTKASNASYDWTFKTIREVPAGGSKGQVLTKVSGLDFDFKFVEPPTTSYADWTKIVELKSPGSFQWHAPDIYQDGLPYEIGVFIIGGGGSGGAAKCSVASGSFYAVATGGASGYTKTLIMTVTPGAAYSITVGEGGAPAGTSTNIANGEFNGNNGGDSAFNGKSCKGGQGGKAAITNYSTDNVQGANGGQGSDSMLSFSGELERFPQFATPKTAPHFGRSTATNFSQGTLEPTRGGFSIPAMCINPFNRLKYLGAGGGATVYCDGSVITKDQQIAPTLDDGEKAGDGITSSESVLLTGIGATSPGSGGGAAASGIKTSATTSGILSGAGAPGAVLIYSRQPIR